MRSLLIAAALLLVGLGAPASVAALTAAQLENACAGIGLDGQPPVTVHDRQLATIACYSYVSGFLGGYGLGSGMPTLRPDRPICFPANGTNPDVVIGALRGWLAQHPEQASLQAFMVLSAALAQAYPCPAAARP